MAFGKMGPVAAPKPLAPNSAASVFHSLGNASLAPKPGKMLRPGGSGRRPSLAHTPGAPVNLMSGGTQTTPFGHQPAILTGTDKPIPPLA